MFPRLRGQFVRKPNSARESRRAPPPSIDLTASADSALLAELDALRLRAAEQHGLLDEANDIIYTHDLQGRFTYVNQAGVRTYGYTLEEFLAMTIVEIVDPTSLALAMDNITRKMGGGQRTEPYEVLTRTKAGLPVLVERSTRLVRGDDGTPRYVQGIARDIGERKRAELEIEASRELLRATIESTADGILVVNSAGRVVHTNSRLFELWRIPPSLVDARDNGKLIAFVFEQLADPEAFLARIRDLHGSDAEDVNIVRFKDDRVFEQYSRPLLSPEGVAGRVWSFRDTTERMRAEV